MKEPLKSRTNQLLLVAATSIAFTLGLITGVATTQVPTAEVNNVVQETEVHYYENGAILTMTATYHEDGSVDTHTEYSYPMYDMTEEDNLFNEDTEFNNL